MKFWVTLVLAFSIFLSVTAILRIPQCTQPATIRYGRYSGQRRSHYRIGSILRMWCNNGYQLHGHKHLICLYKNRVAVWSHKLPLCISKYQYRLWRYIYKSTHTESSSSRERSRSNSDSGRKRCSRPHSPPGGVVKVTGRVWSRAIYSCNKGRLLKGNRIRKCQRNGRWSGSQPSCLSKPYKDSVC